MTLLAISRKNDNSKKSTETKSLPYISDNQIQIDQTAKEQIRILLATAPKAKGLRVGIVGGGCSGFSYNYTLEENFRTKDVIFESEDIKVCVDTKSLKLIGGSLLAWQDKMGSKGFRLLNPKKVKSCSCGESFSL